MRRVVFEIGGQREERAVETNGQWRDVCEEIRERLLRFRPHVERCVSVAVSIHVDGEGCDHE